MRAFGYTGQHSVVFGTKDTWNDWHLIPTSRPQFDPPDAKTNYVDIPGANGQLDLSEALTGYPVFENREGSMEFVVVQEQYGDWLTRMTTIMRYLHGRELEAYLTDEPYFRYKGRFTVNKWESGQANSTVTIDYSVYPYKLEPNASDEPWLWDPFDFEYGVIREFSGMSIQIVPSAPTVDQVTEYTVIIPRSEDPQIPEFYVTFMGDGSTGMTATCDGVTYKLKNGLNVIPQIQVNLTTEKTVTFKGYGILQSISMRGGWF